MALHLIIYRCTACNGPVVAVRLGQAGAVGGVGEGNELPPGQLDQIGDPTCMQCGHVQHEVAQPGASIQFPPVPWD
jgi:hypothetical protein